MMLKNEENEDVYVDSWLWPSVFMEPRGYKTCHTCTNCPGIQILLAAKEDDRIARNVDVEIKVRVVAGSTFYAFPIRYVFGLSGLLRRQRRPNRHINNSPRCAVCLEETAAVANIPCGHIATCQACAESLRDERCCICREQVTSTLQIYF